MARSSLSGVDRSLPTPSGHDTTSLGPSDSSDTGSDIAGVEGLDDGDPAAPIDVTTAADIDHPSAAAESVAPGADTDAGGTGERRSAGGDAGSRDAPDIAPDRVVSLPEISAGADEFESAPLEEPEPPDLGAVDAALASEREAEEGEEDETERAMPANDVSRAAPRARSAKARKPAHGKGARAKPRASSARR